MPRIRHRRRQHILHVSDEIRRLEKVNNQLQLMAQYCNAFLSLTAQDTSQWVRDLQRLAKRLHESEVDIFALARLHDPAAPGSDADGDRTQLRATSLGS